MPKLIGSPTPLPARGADQHVEEYFGLVNSGDAGVSVAYHRCPAGWRERAKCSKFKEFAVVLKGNLRVEHADGVVEAGAGQAVHIGEDEWVRFSAPGDGGAEYLAVCLPAFSPSEIRWEE